MADTNFLATLDDPTLFREANYINGLWLEVGEGRSITVTNPATGKVLGRVPSFPPPRRPRNRCRLRLSSPARVP